LRDDVKVFFYDLQKLLESKQRLLNSLLENEKSASDLIKNRNDAEDDILKIIENETALIEEINIIDYDISKIKDEITRRYAFDFNKLFRKDYITSEAEIMNFRNEVLFHKKIINEIVALKKENNSTMNKSHKDLELQISELERMGRIKIVFPKDLRSS
jgi:hypothetical protein